ncbi:MAG: fumarylacetoacetate hydrolase family protein [Candidatus Riflebacteria bacterium]|nr:fumarylacetoacetate hydrolase family protein [Candidatus Riflebacteria bacterium]
MNTILFNGTKILCVARNYKPHAEELGNAVPKEPLWFTKPPSSIIAHNGTIILPEGFGRIDYEGELAVVISRKAKNVSQPEAYDYIDGVTAAIDVTARELQKLDGQWTRAKGFDTFCPLGPKILPFSKSWLESEISTILNGKTVQNDHLTSLIFPIDVLISHISKVMTLERGDIILTGTPAGVGPLNHGDNIEVVIDGPERLSIKCSAKSQSTVQNTL